MRHIGLVLIAIALIAAVSVAQEHSPYHVPGATPPAALQSYVVQLTEFRLKSSLDPRLTASDIVQSFDQMKSDGTLDLIETVRLSALAGHESMVQYGKRATVTVGTMSVAERPGLGSGRGPVRQTQQQMVGTIMRITAEPQEGKVLLKLTYEASRLDGEGREDSPPDTTTVQFNTTLLIAPGKPMLAGGTSAGGTSFLLVSIEE